MNVGIGQDKHGDEDEINMEMGNIGMDEHRMRTG
jgi:hypothetical protein